jgi:hypothetical protein
LYSKEENPQDKIHEKFGSENPRIVSWVCLTLPSEHSFFSLFFCLGLALVLDIVLFYVLISSLSMYLSFLFSWHVVFLFSCSSSCSCSCTCHVNGFVLINVLYFPCRLSYDVPIFVLVPPSNTASTASEIRVQYLYSLTIVNEFGELLPTDFYFFSFSLFWPYRSSSVLMFS